MWPFRKKAKSKPKRPSVQEYREKSLDGYRKNSDVVKGVMVLATNDSCPACKQLDRVAFPLKQPPKLPNPQCTHRKGCRCALAPVTKTWAELGFKDVPETGKNFVRWATPEEIALYSRSPRRR